MAETIKKPGGQRRELDLELLERFLSDPAVTVGEAARRMGIHRNTLYASKDSDPERRAVWERAMRRRKLNKPVTVKVREAIARGCDTRSKIAKATGLWYDQIERGLSNLGNAISSDDVDGVEHFTLL